MNQIVTKINDKKDWLSRQTWIVPACFVFSCLLTVSAVVFLVIRGFGGMEPTWIFSVGADIFCMAVCAMLCFSAAPNSKAYNADTHVFVTMLTTNSFALFIDEISWLVQGNPALRVINLIDNVIFYMLG